MFTQKELMALTPKELKENWTEVTDSTLKLLGDRELTEEDKEHLKNNE